MAPPRIYLAGPEVFLPDAAAVGAAKAALCTKHGFTGLFPLDATLDLAGLAKPGQARRIYEANEGLMRSCAGLIANLTPFRGVSADAGTAFEVGFMRALGRPVFGYSNVRAGYVERSQEFRRERRAQPDADASDVAIEDFDGAENLMIEMAIAATGGHIVRNAVARGQEMRDLAGFEACLLQARTHFRLERMVIYVDADACPVKDEAVRVAERHGIEIHFVSNSWMRLPEGPLIRRMVVSDGPDAADDWIAERAGKHDIVVTADIPLAARCLKTGARVVGNTGKPFTEANIGQALAMRDFSRHLRETGESKGYNASFTRADRSRFLQALEEAVQAIKRNT